MIFNIGRSGKYPGKPHYRIESYTFGWTVAVYEGTQERHDKKTGVSTTEDKWRVFAYCLTLDHAIKSLAEAGLRWAEGTSVVEALAAVQQIGDDLRVAFAAALPPAPATAAGTVSEAKEPESETTPSS